MMSTPRSRRRDAKVCRMVCHVTPSIFAFGNHPYLGVPGRSAVATEEPEAALQAEFVFLLVVRVEFSPIAGHVPREEVQWGLSCLSQRSQCAGRGDNLAERKQSCSVRFLHGFV